MVTSGFPANVRQQLDVALQAVHATPGDAGLNGHLGMLLQAYQQLDLAELFYQRARAFGPKSFEWAYYLAVVETIHGKTEQAVASARGAVELQPDSRPARMRLAEALLLAREPQESRKIYAVLVAEEPDLALYRYGLGKAAAAAGDRTTALEQYKRACELLPGYGPAHYALAMAYRDGKDMEQAGRQLALYQKRPKGAPPEDAMMAQVSALNQGGLGRAQAAEQLMNDGRPREAAVQLEAAVATDPNDETAHANLVAAYWELHDYPKAEQHYRVAARLNPSTRAHYVYGLVLYDQKRYAEAVATFHKAVELNPRDNGANTQLGRAMEAQGDLKGAARQYRAALESDPNSRATNYLLGQLLLRSGQGEEAIRCLEKTLEPVDEKTLRYAQELGLAWRRQGNEEKARYYLAQGANGTGAAQTGAWNQP